MMTDLDLVFRFGAALFIGILVGLQREHAFENLEGHERQEMLAGVRTFAIVALTGATAAFVAEISGSIWAFVSVVLIFGIMLTAGYVMTASRDGIGITTEVAAITTMLTGALCVWDQLPIAAVIAVAMTALLSLKIELHGLASKITREDILATLKFAVITAVILPVLPRTPLGPAPFDVVNAYQVWLMVVLISAISFLGFVLIKIVGSQKGIGLTGLLGGLVSSTAVTMSFSQRSQTDKLYAKSFALAIIISWTVMFVRVLVEVGALYVPLLQHVWLPLTAAGLVALLYGAYLHFTAEKFDSEGVDVSNPFELGPAIKFGALYGAILLISRAAELYFGNTGLYLSSIVSGVADVDAITLSMAQLSRSGNIEMATAARAIVLATMSNTVVKGGIVMTLGSKGLRRAFLPAFLLVLITGTGLAFFG